MPRRARTAPAADTPKAPRQRKTRQFSTITVQVPTEIKNIIDGIERATGVGEIDQVRAALIRYAADVGPVTSLAARVSGITDPAEVARILATLPEASHTES